MAPTQQTAFFLETPGGAFAVHEKPVPTAGPGELLIKIEAAALNPLDWKMQAYKLDFMAFPAVLGSDAAGIVEALGEGVTTFKLGDRVVWQGKFDGDHAALQQYAIASAEYVAKVPDHISLEQAASIPLGLASGFLGMYQVPSDAQGGGADLEHFWSHSATGKYVGKPFVVLGGGSSVGQYTIQLAKLSGFSPIITTASSANAPLLETLGATHVLPRSLADADLKARIDALTTGASVTVVFDAIGIPETEAAGWPLVPSGGSFVTVAGPWQCTIAVPGQQKQVAYLAGNVHWPGQEAVGRELYAQLEGWLKGGSITPNRVQVLPGGLNAVEGGLSLLKENKVSAVKLIVRPHDL